MHIILQISQGQYTLHNQTRHIACLKIKFGGARFLLDILKYAIFENYRYVLDQEQI